MAGQTRSIHGRGVGFGNGESVLEQLVHQRLRVRQGGDAVADVADGRDPELRTEDTGRPAVVGHGHDCREVARVLLEAAQERGQPGPTTDGHDARSAGQEPLLVDDLDERLVGIGRTQGIRHAPHRPIATDGEQTDADRPDDQAAQRVRQELQGHEIDECPGQPARFQPLSDLADQVSEGERQQEQAEEDDQQPALDPDPGRQPAAQVHDRSSSR